MIHRLQFLLLSICLSLLSLDTKAISFQTPHYIAPYQFLEDIQSKQTHPSHNYFQEVITSIESTAFLPKRGTGVLISSDGLLVTAAHVISHAYIRESDHCPKLNFFLNHERDENGKFLRHKKLICEKVLAYDYNHDFALIKLRNPENKPLPFVSLAKLENGPNVGTNAYIIGHPQALSWTKSSKKISTGPIVFNASNDSDFPHFLHLINTEGGHSGGPIFNMQGKLLGIHFRGIPHYSSGVETIIDGEAITLKRFNVAIDSKFIYERLINY